MSINDITFAALARFGGSLNDKLLAFYKLNGGADKTQLNDAEASYLRTFGATPGDLNDMWMEFLTGKGYSGTLNDMRYQFILDGGLEAVPSDYTFTIANDGSGVYGYLAGSYGAISPDTVRGVTMTSLTGDSLVNLVSMDFGGQKLLADSLTLTISGASTTVTWSDSANAYETFDGGFAAVIQANDGTAVTLTISV